MEPVEKQPAVPASKEKAPTEDRLIMLCDGIFAIAMTLLVLDIKLPTNVTPRVFSDTLGNMDLTILGYLITFYVLASYWLGHRHLMQDIRRMDSIFIWLTFLFLAFVAFFPAVSPILLQRNKAIPEAVIIYTLVLSGCGFSLLLMRLYASWNHRLIDTEMDRDTILYKLALTFIGPAVFCLSLLLLYVVSDPSEICFAWLLVAILPRIIRLIYERGQRQSATAQERPKPEQEPAKATAR